MITLPVVSLVLALLLRFASLRGQGYRPEIVRVRGTERRNMHPACAHAVAWVE